MASAGLHLSSCLQLTFPYLMLWHAFCRTQLWICEFFFTHKTEINVQNMKVKKLTFWAHPCRNTMTTWKKAHALVIKKNETSQLLRMVRMRSDIEKYLSTLVLSACNCFCACLHLTAKRYKNLLLSSGLCWKHYCQTLCRHFLMQRYSYPKVVVSNQQ